MEITDSQALATARNLISTSSNGLWMCGKVILYPATYNPKWPYHFRPESVKFVQETIEIQQGVFVPPLEDPNNWVGQNALCVPADGIYMTEIGSLRP